MSNFPVVIRKSYKEFLQKFNKGKRLEMRLRLLTTFRLSFLMPEIPEISDP